MGIDLEGEQRYCQALLKRWLFSFTHSAR